MKQYCLNFDDWYMEVYKCKYSDSQHDKKDIKRISREYQNYRHKEWRKLNESTDKHI